MGTVGDTDADFDFLLYSFPLLSRLKNKNEPCAWFCIINSYLSSEIMGHFIFIYYSISKINVILKCKVLLELSCKFNQLI